LAAIWIAKTLCCCNGRATAGCVLADADGLASHDFLAVARAARRAEVEADETTTRVESF
jgi:hypothetical protein